MDFDFHLRRRGDPHFVENTIRLCWGLLDQGMKQMSKVGDTRRVVQHRLLFPFENADWFFHGSQL